MRTVGRPAELEAVAAVADAAAVCPAPAVTWLAEVIELELRFQDHRPLVARSNATAP